MFDVTVKVYSIALGKVSVTIQGHGDYMLTIEQLADLVENCEFKAHKSVVNHVLKEAKKIER